MRLPRPQFTVRRLMLVVALAGLALGGGIWGSKMWRLSGVHARTARFHRSWLGLYRQRETVILKSLGRLEQFAAQHALPPPSVARHRDDAAGYARKADFREALALKYERAARYPWLPVETDPPEP